MLKIKIPTEPSSRLANIIQQAQPQAFRTSVVEVFMRVALLAPGTKDLLILPEVFPTRAPVLTNRVTSIQRSGENTNN